ncbi:MAG: hypothetical protein JKY49_09270 [Cohaesibacteraceae bacterium]|nr:hypothetical protein [Cohaesibacteraceae bacterium]
MSIATNTLKISCILLLGAATFGATNWAFAASKAPGNPVAHQTSDRTETADTSASNSPRPNSPADNKNCWIETNAHWNAEVGRMVMTDVKTCTK